MQIPSIRRRWWHKIFVSLAYSSFGYVVLSRIGHHLDHLTLRLTSGRQTLSEVLTGKPIFSLTTTGAKSGQPRSMPVLGTPDGDSVLLVASNWGQKRHPSWYYNLRANPQATLAIQGSSGTFLAQELSGAEREQAWAKACAFYPGYEVYKRRASHRTIPVVRLTPCP